MVLRRAVGSRNTLLVALSLFGAACSSGDSSTPQGPVDDTPAVEAVRIIEKADVQVAGEVERAAIDYVRTYDSNLRLTEKDGFTLKSTKLGADKFSHVRLQQTYQDIPVWGADVVVHADERPLPRAQRHAGQAPWPISTSSRRSPPTRRSPSARPSIGARARAPRSPGLDVLARVRPSSSSSPARAQRRPRLARPVLHRAAGRHQPGPVELLHRRQERRRPPQFNGIHTLEQASGPGGNPKVTRTWDAELDVEPSGRPVHDGHRAPASPST